VIDVALARCVELPEPDPDEAPLLAALRARGLSADALPWDGNPWEARLTVLRATWNYPHRLADFLAWAEGVPRLLNPFPLVAWNAHKGYLLGLERAGVPIVPTAVLPRGCSLCLAEVCAGRGWGDVVVKPAVGAGSLGARRGAPDDLEGHWNRLRDRGDVLVQPYQGAVEGRGERAIVWIDGAVTHAVRKAPRWEGGDEAVTGPMDVSAAERTVAEAAVAVARRVAEPLYARVDVIDGGGGPRVMELELIEPSLFFSYGAEACTRMAEAIARRM
jgi:glutathione synthase/RimK-type ligase-like ATP-grasp enzyme